MCLNSLLNVSYKSFFSGHTTPKISTTTIPRKLERTGQRLSCMAVRSAAPAAQAATICRIIDLNRLQRPAHMTNVVLNRIQHLVNMAAEH